jgi:hypothetical protein
MGKELKEKIEGRLEVVITKVNNSGVKAPMLKT